MHMIRPSRLLKLGVLLLLVAVFAPVLSSYNPVVGDVSDGNLAPSIGHWLGTDDQGRDVLARVMYGARLSLSVAAISVGIGVVSARPQDRVVG